MTITRVNSKSHYKSVNYTSSVDANDMTTTGIYHFKASITNAPITNHGTLIVDYDVGTPYQVYMADNQSTAYKRWYTSGAWTSWVKLGSSDFIPISGGTFTGDIGVKAASPVLNFTCTNIDASKSNNNVSSTTYPSTSCLLDSAGRIMSRLEAVVQSNGVIQSYWYTRNYNTSGRYVGQKGIRQSMNKSGTLTWTVDDAANFRSAIGAAASSDRRLKSDIEPLGEDAVEFISNLEPVVYTINGERQVGLIAQDVNEADPWGTRMAFETQEGIDGLDDWEKMPDGSPTWKLDYIRIIAPLVATVQELSANVEALTDRVKELEGKLADQQ